MSRPKYVPIRRMIAAIAADPFDRYKMPELVVRTEGKQKHYRTALVNLGDVARALCRPPMPILVFIASRLGAQFVSKAREDRYLLKGLFTAAALDNQLDAFIRAYVLCERCELPETQLRVADSASLVLSAPCNACGHTGQPRVRGHVHDAVVRALERSLASSHGRGADSALARSQRAADSDDGDDNPMNTLANRVAAVSLTSNNDNANGNGNVVVAAAAADDDDDDSVEWFTDTSDAAVAQRRAEAERRFGSLETAANAKPAKRSGEQRRAEALEALARLLAADAASSVSSIAAVARGLLAKRAHRDWLAVLDLLAPALAAGADSEAVARELELRTPLLAVLVADAPAANARALLDALAERLGAASAAVRQRAPILLHRLYMADALDEDTVLAWAARAAAASPRAASVCRAAAAFLDWLRTAEEEEEAEEEEAGANEGSNSTSAGDDDDDDDDDNDE